MNFDSMMMRMWLAVLGREAIAELARSPSSQPALLLAGGQLSGKSTAAKTVAAELDGQIWSSGERMRQAARAEGISLEELNRRHAIDSSLDVRLDFAAAQAVARGEVVVLESRLAGHIGTALRQLGRKNLVMVRLDCSPVEVALRFVARRLGARVRAILEPRLALPPGLALPLALQRLAAEPEADEIQSEIGACSDRDACDSARLRSLYGVTWTDDQVYDHILDTTNMEPKEVAATLVPLVFGSPVKQGRGPKGTEAPSLMHRCRDDESR